MRILIAPDSFKQSLTAEQAAGAIARGAERAAQREAKQLHIDLCPVADGGEGTVAALVAATGGERRQTRVSGPLGEPVNATWGVLGSAMPVAAQSPSANPIATACIEIAEAAGLHLVPPGQRDPTRTTTFGVGELISAALDAGCRRIVVGLGGSATTDGGAGMAQALGASFTQSDGRPCVCGLAGGGLRTIHAIDLNWRDPRLVETEMIAACDVTNPLLGPNGSAAVYSPQKGATTKQVEQLDAALAHLARLLGVDPQQPGFGAAGGLGFGMSVFCGAKLERGVDMVLDAVGFDARVAEADLIITGEGQLDHQSLSGKACMGVASRAAASGVPTIALVGNAGERANDCIAHGLTAFHTLVDEAGCVERAMAEAEATLEALAERVVFERWFR